MAPHMQPQWEPLRLTYPPSMQLLPHQTPIVSMGDQGNTNLEFQASTNYMDEFMDEPSQTMDTIKWKMQFGQHEIDFCPKCNKDLIHHSLNFSMQLDGIHREQECEEQQSLNKQFRRRMLINKVECEASKDDASAGQRDR
jgi:hypothetical protein